MNRSWIPWALAWMLCLAALISFWQGARYFFIMRQLQQTQSQMASFEYLQNSLRNFAEECVLYSRTNNAIDPILQRFDLKPDTGRQPSPASPTSTAPQPAKPRTR